MDVGFYSLDFILRIVAVWPLDAYAQYELYTLRKRLELEENQ